MHAPLRSLLLLLGLVAMSAACERRSGANQARRDAGAPANGEPRARFWAWFGDAAGRMRGGDPSAATERINQELRMLGLGVTAELEPGDVWRLVITADGDPALFPEVERLVASAMPPAGWTVVAFRQRVPLAGRTIRMDGGALAIDDVRVVVVVTGALLDVRVFLPGYAPGDEAVERRAFVAIANAVGERDMELHVGKLAWRPAAEAPADAHPLARLPELLDQAARAGG